MNWHSIYSADGIDDEMPFTKGLRFKKGSHAPRWSGGTSHDRPVRSANVDPPMEQGTARVGRQLDGEKQAVVRVGDKVWTPEGDQVTIIAISSDGGEIAYQIAYKYASEEKRLPWSEMKPDYRSAALFHLDPEDFIVEAEAEVQRCQQELSKVEVWMRRCKGELCQAKASLKAWRDRIAGCVSVESADGKEKPTGPPELALPRPPSFRRRS